MNVTTLTTLFVVVVGVAFLAAVATLTVYAVRADSRGFRPPPRSRNDAAPGMLPSRPYREIGV
jgi:cytochrome c-type biogenesis protein CcmE